MIYAGADVLFVGKGADVGVTVSPIRINSLREFGTVEAVGDRLLGAEKAKASPWLRHALAYANKLGMPCPGVYPAQLMSCFAGDYRCPCLMRRRARRVQPC